MTQAYTTARKATTLMILSVLSPIAGLTVEISLAWAYGSSGTVDAFRIASLLILLGNQLFLSQMLPNVIIPTMSEYRANKKEEEGWRVAFSLANIIVLVILPFVAVTMICPEILLKLLGPGLTASASVDAQHLLRFFALAFVLMIWTGTMNGILNVYQVFWLPPVAQLLTNLFMIFAILSVGRQWGGLALTIGVLAGVVVSFGLYIACLRRIAMEHKINIDIRSCLAIEFSSNLVQGLKMLFSLLGIIFLGQWFIIIMNRSLSELSPGTLATFGYAWKMLLIISFAPAALTTVIFPAASAAHAKQNSQEMERLIIKAVRMVGVITLPISLLVFETRGALVELLFQHGEMSRQAVFHVAEIISALVWSAPAAAIISILRKVSFARKNTLGPIAQLFVLALCMSIIAPFATESAGAWGLALAYTIILWVTALALLGYIFVKNGMRSIGEFAIYTLKLAFVMGCVLLVVSYIHEFFAGTGKEGFFLALGEVISISVVGMIVFLIISKLVRIKETDDILNYVNWHLRRLMFRD